TVARAVRRALPAAIVVIDRVNRGDPGQAGAVGDRVATRAGDVAAADHRQQQAEGDNPGSRARRTGTHGRTSGAKVVGRDPATLSRAHGAPIAASQRGLRGSAGQLSWRYQSSGWRGTS